MDELNSILLGLRHIAKQLDSLNPKEFQGQSDEVDLIHEALVNAQQDISALFTDSSGYTGKFASLPGIIAHIKEPLGKNGLAFTQELNEVNNNPYVFTTIRHLSGQWIRSKTRIFFPARTEVPSNKDYNQECGKSISYMRRYALESILGLKADREDFDSK